MSEGHSKALGTQTTRFECMTLVKKFTEPKVDQKRQLDKTLVNARAQFIKTTRVECTSAIYIISGKSEVPNP